MTSSDRVRAMVLELRTGEGMVLDADDHDTWSVGSFFVNPFVPATLAPPDCPQWEVDGQLKLSAAWLIEHAGFTRGYGSGPVGLSSKHTLALVNRGSANDGATARAGRRDPGRVEARFGIRLRPEAHLVAVDF